MDIEAGDKVVCVDDVIVNPEVNKLFPEMVQRGHLYIVEGIRENGPETVIDIRGIVPEKMDDGRLPGFKLSRFKKL